jgi:hypothetical protein
MSQATRSAHCERLLSPIKKDSHQSKREDETVRKKLVTLGCGLALLSNDIAAQSDRRTFHKTWPDINYVLCEGMGFTATGEIDVTVEYSISPGIPALPAVNCQDYACESQNGGSHPAAPAIPPSYSINKLFIVADYLHYSEITGTALMPFDTSLLPATRGQVVRPTPLVKPWFDTMGPPGTGQNQLVLPPLDPKGTYPRLPRDAQMPHPLDIGKPITLDIAILFPRDGGNCSATFHKTFTLE